METGGWDLDLVFDETYPEFYRDLPSPERTRAECDRIVRLLGPPTGGRLAALPLAERSVDGACCEAGARLRTRRRYEPVDGPERSVEFSLLRYDAASFAGMLKTAGFTAVRALDGNDGTPAETAPRVVFVGRRPAGDP